MQLSQAPTKVTVPFASSATFKTNPIPLTQTVGSGSASWTTGFPLENFTPAGAGGTPNHLQDFNGVMFHISSWDQWYNLGNPVPFDSTFANEIGGYPNGALLASATTPGNLWLSLIDNNTVNPDTTVPVAPPYLSGAGIINTTFPWQLVPGIINTAVVYTVDGVGGTFGHFFDLVQCLNWLSQFRITQNGSVTINITAGIQYYGTPGSATPSPSIVIDHPNANRITINGAAPPNLSLNINYLGQAGTPGQSLITNLVSDGLSNNGPYINITQLASGQSNNIQAPYITLQLQQAYATTIGFVFPAASGIEVGLIVKTPGVTINNLNLMGVGGAVGQQGVGTGNSTENGALFDIRAKCTISSVSICSAGSQLFSGAGIAIRNNASLVCAGTGTLLSSQSSAGHAMIIEDGGSLSYGNAGNQFTNNIILGYCGGDALFCDAGVFGQSLNGGLTNLYAIFGFTNGIEIRDQGTIALDTISPFTVYSNNSPLLVVGKSLFTGGGSGSPTNFVGDTRVGNSNVVHASEGSVVVIPGALNGGGSVAPAISILADTGSFVDASRTSGRNFTYSPSANTVGNQRAYILES